MQQEQVILPAPIQHLTLHGHKREDVYWLGVVGSRSREDRDGAVSAIIRFLLDRLEANPYQRVGIISGGAKGPDTWAAYVARELDLPLWEVRPNLAGLAKRAPRWAFTKRFHARNLIIAGECDRLLAFVAANRTGGTEHTLHAAQRLGKPCTVHPAPALAGIS